MALARLGRVGQRSVGEQSGEGDFFVTKASLELLLLLWLRWSLPGLGFRSRERLAWKVLLPLSLINFTATVGVAALV
jgi:NADH:ubiquinone oxidoreductase subunit H